jgi:hypothetical protein
MLWPVVRSLETCFLEGALDQVELSRSPTESEALLVLDSVLFGMKIASSKFPSDIVPFVAVAMDRVVALPHAPCATPLAEALYKMLPNAGSWLGRLPRIQKSVRDMAASVLKFSDFQKTSFVVMAAYMSLLLIRELPVGVELDDSSASQMLVRELQPFVNKDFVLHDESPFNEDKSNYFPFTNSKMSGLHDHFVRVISRIKANSGAAFHAGHGTNAKADFYFVVRGQDTGDKKRFHVLIGDAKHSIDSNPTVAKQDAEQVLFAKKCLLELWRGHWPDDSVTTTLFVISPAKTVRDGWPSSVCLLNGDSLSFLPWTLFLFRDIVVE